MRKALITALLLALGQSVAVLVLLQPYEVTAQVARPQACPKPTVPTAADIESEYRALAVDAFCLWARDTYPRIFTVDLTATKSGNGWKTASVELTALASLTPSEVAIEWRKQLPAAITRLVATTKTATKIGMIAMIESGSDSLIMHDLADTRNRRGLIFRTRYALRTKTFLSIPLSQVQSVYLDVLYQ